MNLSSMIVFQIDVDGFAFDPTECDAPVSAGVDSIAALVAANERMKAEPRQVHVLGPRRVVERPQNVGYPFRILHAEPASVPGREKPFEGPVAERADHAQQCKASPYDCQAMPYTSGGLLWPTAVIARMSAIALTSGGASEASRRRMGNMHGLAAILRGGRGAQERGHLTPVNATAFISPGMTAIVSRAVGITKVHAGRELRKRNLPPLYR